MQEFAAHQQVLSSTSLRWVEILRKLQSPNPNFGEENIVFMIKHFVMQAGPAKGRSELGDVHSLFLDPAFRTEWVRESISGSTDEHHWRSIRAPIGTQIDVC